MTYRARTLLAAIGLAVLAALFVGFYVSNYKRSVQHSQQHVSVYVASRDIPAGTSGADVLKGDYMKTEQVLRSSVVPGAIASPKQLAPLVAAEATYAGEQVSLSRFSTAAETGVRGLLRGPLRAVQIAGDGNQTLAGTLQGGDRVDLVASLKVNPDKGVAATRIVLRNLRVLRAPGGLTDKNKSLTSTGPGNSSYSVLVAVTDTQVQKLFYVMKNSDWTLELRPIVKASDSPESVETLDSLLTDGLSRAQLLQLQGKGVR